MRNFTCSILFVLAGCVDYQPPVDADGDGFSGAEDCDDGNPSVNPGAVDVPCNGVDEDCSGGPDEAVPRLGGYLDEDGDAFGQAGPYVEGCDAVGVVGLVQNADDCNDTNPNINPDAVEIPGNGADEDCDGQDGELEIIDADEDGYSADVDCNDDNSAIHPDAVETCNGFDDDCDELTDDADTNVAGQDEFYKDADKDGYGRPDRTVMACQLPDGYATNSEDCDDGDYTVHPGAPESCTDLADLNCDGLFGATDNDGDGYFACQECDDANLAVNPGATEVCNGVDDDCKNGVDDGVLTTYYYDADQDGYGSVVSKEACSAPAGYTSAGGDCDDARATVNPGMSEVCNDRDDNCNTVVDEGVLLAFYKDADADGFGSGTSAEACTPPAGYVANENDCNDANKQINPNAQEVCDAVDNDCNGTVDLGAADAKTWYQDTDKDGYGGSTSTKACTAPAGYVSTSTDCDDASASVSPTGTEVCNGKDDNCDGAVDNGAIGSNTYYADSDKDGYGDSTKSAVQCSPPAGYVLDNTDCLDSDKLVYPGQTEVCNGKDDDCKNGIDDGVKTVYYKDGDADGYGDLAQTTQACQVPAGYSANATDCLDTDRLVNPGQTEVCNGKDDNCAGGTDEGVKTTYYVDADNDAFGSATGTKDACSAPAGYVSDKTDCADANKFIYPGATEVCNGVDDDCDTAVDENVKITYYKDGDNDTYGDSTLTTQACSVPAGYATNATDCLDSDKLVNPGQVEVCNGKDDNCTNGIDEGVKITYYRDQDADGYGTAVTSTACLAPAGYSASSGDCDDRAPYVHPGVAESAKTASDDDCNGAFAHTDGVTTYFADATSTKLAFTGTNLVASTCDVTMGCGTLGGWQVKHYTAEQYMTYSTPTGPLAFTPTLGSTRNAVQFDSTGGYGFVKDECRSYSFSAVVGNKYGITFVVVDHDSLDATVRVYRLTDYGVNGAGRSSAIQLNVATSNVTMNTDVLMADYLTAGSTTEGFVLCAGGVTTSNAVGFTEVWIGPVILQ